MIHFVIAFEMYSYLYPVKMYWIGLFLDADLWCFLRKFCCSSHIFTHKEGCARREHHIS